MPAILREFQEQICAALVARFANVRSLYQQVERGDPGAIDATRRREGAAVLQAPTGAGKTLIAVEAMRRVSAGERVLWFWFAPFTGLVDQSRRVIAAQAPELRLLDLASDRHLDSVRSGGVFVVTWASLAARNADSRLARQRGDSGQAIDALIDRAREEGLRIACVVDEAHHGFQRAAQARAFFAEVLKPDYAVLMTATPRDADMPAFEKASGYRLGRSEDWFSVSRTAAVEAGLLKQGVRMVRFLARDGDTAQLVDFEHLALRECAALHRRIAAEMASLGVPLTPLMLVQVPDGKAAQEAARRYLVDGLRFAESAVRVHTADEPDPDLLSLAEDPTVEVLVFKMAVALGFDAPRACTLAALRGARDVDFGVQVIGRIVRRHVLLQGRALPPLLEHGYVFLANSASQEGLLAAGAQISAMTNQLPEIGTQSILTMVGDSPRVQVARSGEPLSLLIEADSASLVRTESDGRETVVSRIPSEGLSAQLADTPYADLAAVTQGMFDLAGGSGERAPREGRAEPFLLTSPPVYRYRKRSGTPDRLRGEQLPPVPADFEAHLAAHVNFSPEVLADRLRHRVQVRREEADLFSGSGVAEEPQDIWASLEPEAVADRAEQIRLRLSEANDRELYQRLLDAFVGAIERSGAEPPEDEEERMQQLDLVLVRRPSLLREAYKRMLGGHIVDVDVVVPGEITSAVRLESASRGLYGVFPPDLNGDERLLANLLDADPLVRWWHRNPPRSGVGLYRWDEGEGFYPDFVVCVEGRAGAGMALVEVKGEHLWGKDSEVDKSHARHPDYGLVRMVGRSRGERDFVYLHDIDRKLSNVGAFNVASLRLLG